MQASPNQVRSLDVTETAKLVRKALKAEFPGVKFSVRSDRYAGGSSVSVGWTDGPRERDVQGVCGLYAGATFDGMSDCMNYHESMLTTEAGAELVRFGADFVSAHRRISEERHIEAGRMIEEATGEPCDLSPKGAGWNTMYRVAVFDGELATEVPCAMEYGHTLAHQITAARDYRENR